MSGFRVSIYLLVALLCAGAGFAAAEPRTSEPFIDWAVLRNPIYEHEGWSVKDACMIHHQDTFYIYFSAFFRDRGRERSHVSGVRTRDFQTFSQPLFIWDGREDGWVGMCSPNITRSGDTFYLTYNSWGDDHENGMPNQLFYATSKDLESWDKHMPIARDVTVNEEGEPRRAIDIALSPRVNGRHYMVWKARQTPQIAWSETIGAAGWHVLGRPVEPWFENGQFIEIDGRWHMLITSRPPRGTPGPRPHGPYLVPMLGDGRGLQPEDWMNWGELQPLEPPLESFNTHSRYNAAFLADWRAHDGFFYLLYAGNTEGQSHAGRGDNRLGLSRSRDLKSWFAAGDPGQ